MFFSLIRHSQLSWSTGALLAVLVAISLSACSSTSTSSGASRATTSVDEPAQEQQPDEMVQESVDTATEPAEMQPEAETPIPPPVVTQLPDESDAGVTTGAADPVEPVEGVAVFPENPYQIEEDGEEAYDAQEAEIDRLREELAATESELDTMREQESQTDYSADQSASDSGMESDSAGTDGSQHQYDPNRYDSSGDSTGDSSGASPEAVAGATGSSGTDIDMSGKPAEFSIYFGYDVSSFEDRFEPIIVAHAEFMKSNPELRVEIQGNCDERGSREYNIALGQRRANAVKRALELLGVEGDRIDTVSFGSEKPVAFGRDEESWRLNRRADIVY